MADQWTDSDRARLAERIKQRMKELPIDTDAEVIRRGGPSPMTWRKIVQGEGPVATPSYRKVDRVLEWVHGSCEAILAGGEPIETGLTSPEVPQQLTAAEREEFTEARKAVMAALEHIDKILRQSG
jgi:hypothetical protein